MDGQALLQHSSPMASLLSHACPSYRLTHRVTRSSPLPRRRLPAISKVLMVLVMAGGWVVGEGWAVIGRGEMGGKEGGV